MPSIPDNNMMRTLRQENSRLKEENLSLRDEVLRLRQAIQSLNNLQHSLDLITPESNIHALLNGILTSALDAVNSGDGSLLLVDEDTSELVFVQTYGSSREKLAGYRMPAGEGIAGWVITNHTPRLVSDVRQDPHFSPMVDQTTGFRTASLICVPLMDGERVMGAIEVVNTLSGIPFNESDLDLLMLVSRLAVIALLRAEGPRS